MPPEENYKEKPVDLLFGKERKQARLTNTCVWCKGPADEFKDELSRREYAISHVCQKCQDAAFN